MALGAAAPLMRVPLREQVDDDPDDEPTDEGAGQTAIPSLSGVAPANSHSLEASAPMKAEMPVRTQR